MSRKNYNVERFTMRKPSATGRRFNTIIGEVPIDTYAGMNNTLRYLKHFCTDEWKEALLAKLNLPEIYGRWYRISIRASVKKIVFELEVRHHSVRYYTSLDQVEIDNQTILNHLKSLNWNQFDEWCKSIDARTVLLGCEEGKFVHIKYTGNPRRRNVIQSFLTKDYTLVKSKHSFFNMDIRCSGKDTPIHIGFQGNCIEIYIGVGMVKAGPKHRQNSIRAMIQRLPRIDVDELAGYLNHKHQSILEDCEPVVRPFANLSKHSSSRNSVIYGFKWTMPFRSIRYLARDLDHVVDMSSALKLAGKELIINRMFEVSDYA